MTTGARGRVIENEQGITDVLVAARRVAVLGIKPAWTGKPAYYVPEYVQQAGYEIIPVPVYYPDVAEILGARIYRRLSDVPAPIDIVNVFRKSGDVPPHVPDMIAARPRVVWMQVGIRNDLAAEQLTAAGIDVIMNRCMLVEIENRPILARDSGPQ